MWQAGGKHQTELWIMVCRDKFYVHIYMKIISLRNLFWTKEKNISKIDCITLWEITLLTNTTPEKNNFGIEFLDYHDNEEEITITYVQISL